MIKKKNKSQYNKADFIKTISKKMNFTQSQSKEMVDIFLSSIQDILAKGESISFVGFGKFCVINRSAREGRNPSTGEKLRISSSKAVKFSAGELLKNSVNL